MSVSRPPPATSRDHALWQQCWRDRHIDFHQTTPNPLLMRFWPTLAAGARVLVPLCGKSLDMSWLAANGHEVLGERRHVLDTDGDGEARRYLQVLCREQVAE